MSVLRDGDMTDLTVILGRRETSEAVAFPASTEPEEPTQSEIHGLTLIPESGEKPIGFTFEVILRAPDAPQLDVDTRFDSPAAKPVQIDGHNGHQLMLLDGQVGFAAIAGKSGGAGKWGTQITVEYYDERSDFGTAPMTREQAEAWWPVVLGSIKGSVLR